MLSMGIIHFGGLMIYKMQSATSSALLFPVWLGVGALIYLYYGFSRNRSNENEIHRQLVHNKNKQEILK